MTFGNILKMLRTESGLNQEELAKQLGIGRSTLTMYELDTRFPNKEMIESIADYFNVDIDYLYGKSEVRQKVHLDNDGKEHYYLDPETRDYADELKNNKELRMLFDASRKASKEDLKVVYDMLLALKRKERGDDWE